MRIWPFKRRGERTEPPARARPDHSTRFRPGQSGNPAGRRRGVGNDLLEARRIAAGMYLEVGKRSQGRLVNKALCVSLDVIDGLRDESVEVQSVLAGIRRGRVLQRRLTTPAAAEEALSFYATEWAQPEHPFGMAGPAMVPTHALACDYGERARAALGKREKGRAEA